MDIHTKAEYNNGHIEGFLNIPMDNLREQITEIELEKPVYIIQLAPLCQWNEKSDCQTYTGVQFDFNRKRCLWIYIKSSRYANADVNTKLYVNHEAAHHSISVHQYLIFPFCICFCVMYRSPAMIGRCINRGYL